MKHPILFILITIGLLLPNNLQAQENEWLQVVIPKIEDEIKTTDKEIEKTKNDIVCNEKNSVKAEAIITKAKQMKDGKLEAIGKESLQAEKDGKIKNLEILKNLEAKKQNLSVALDAVKKENANLNSSSIVINSLITNYSGNVEIHKANPEKIYFLNNGNPVFLETGDVVLTDVGSKIEMKFLDGRGNVIVEESAELKLASDTTDIQSMNLVKGKITVGVEKVENTIKYLEKLIENCTDEGVKFDYEKMVKYLRAGFEKKFKVRTPSCAIAIRGTKFIISEDAQKGTEIIVLEGIVETTGSQNTRTVLINEGYKCTVNINGEISEPEKIDISKIGK